MEKTKIYFDTEFTGLHNNTTLISIGLINAYGDTFYAEFNDADYTQVDKWLSDNVIANLKFNDSETFFNESNPGAIEIKDNTDVIKLALTDWLKRFDEVEMWSDCLSYDWVLFNNIFGTAFDIPENVYYIPFDLCTVFKLSDIDPDISREEYAGDFESNIPFEKHNALWDAVVIKACCDKLKVK
jgi:hypothetical protein